MPLVSTVKLRHWSGIAKRYAQVCRLDHPTDLVLLLLPAVWGSLLAAKGSPSASHLILLLLAASLLRCAAWVFDDWMEAKLIPKSSESYLGRNIIGLREIKMLLAVLVLLGVVLLLPLPSLLFYYALPAPLLLAAIPFLKTRLLLIQPYLGLCYAWLVPMSYAAQGVQPDKAGWLVFTATMLWVSAFTVLYAMPRREYDLEVGIRSLAQLFGSNSWFFVMAMQLSTVFSLWLAGKQLELGIFFSLGLIVVLLLVPYQQWLVLTHPQKGPIRSYRNQIWSGIAILCGIAFNYMCTCQ